MQPELVREKQQHLYPRYRWGGKDLLKREEYDLLVIAEKKRRKSVAARMLTAAAY